MITGAPLQVFSKLSAKKQQHLIAVAERLGNEFFGRADAYDQSGEFPWENYRRLQEEKFLGLTIPEKYGGLGADPLTWALCLKEIAAGCPSTALTFCMHSTVLVFISAFGTEEQKQRYFQEVVGSGKLFASATSEPGSSFRSSFAIAIFPKTTGGGYVVQVAKHFCSIGEYADYFFVSGIEEGCDSAREGYVSAIIPRNVPAPGVIIKKKWNGAGMRATCSDTVAFDRVVPESDVIGSHGQLPQSGLLNHFALGYAAIYLGIARTAFNFTRKYLTYKREDERVQAVIGEMGTRIEASGFLLQEAAQKMGNGIEDSTLIVNQAKWFACETAVWVTAEAMRLLGGKAITRELPLERLHRDALCGIVMPPHNDRCMETVGKIYLELPASTIEIVPQKT